VTPERIRIRCEMPRGAWEEITQDEFDRRSGAFLRAGGSMTGYGSGEGRVIVMDNRQGRTVWRVEIITGSPE
jgi:hypothetical protein